MIKTLNEVQRGICEHKDFQFYDEEWIHCDPRHWTIHELVRYIDHQRLRIKPEKIVLYEHSDANTLSGFSFWSDRQFSPGVKQTGRKGILVIDQEEE